MDACAGERGARLRVQGRRPLLAAMVTDSAGTGMFLPFTVLYFVHAAGLTVPEVGVALTAAAVAAGAGQATFWTGTRALIAEVAAPGERRSWFALQTALRSAGYGLGGLAGAAAVSVHSPAAFKALAALDAASYLAAALLLLFW